MTDGAAIVRLARRDDVPAVLDIANHYALNTTANFAVEPETLDDWRGAFDGSSDRYPWIVAEVDGAVVGFAKATPWKGRCAYAHSAEVTVYLRPGCAGRGLGKALYRRLFAIMEAQGFRSALGGITLPNDASVALHESMGMKRVALFERIGFKFDAWRDVGYWQINWGDGAPSALRTVAEGAERGTKASSHDA